MEARITRLLVHPLIWLVLCFTLVEHCNAQGFARRPHVANTQNFIVFAATPRLADTVAQEAERFRRELAIHWLGRELPAWPQRCPVKVHAGQVGAGGETSYQYLNLGAGNWNMVVHGTEERILDSVLPHEITHTIFATYFAPLDKYVPRWADEGACTTVEHVSEKRKHQKHLQVYLRTGQGFSFNEMFSLKDYPPQPRILPFYAQGHSVVQFLVEQAGPREFIQFVESGMRSERWEASLKQHYAYETIGELQEQWNQWLRDGSPESLLAYSPLMREQQSSVRLASNSTPIKSGSQTSDLADDSNWYQRRLDDARANMPQGAAERLPVQNTARPLEPQRPQVQVLDWGDGAAIQALPSRSATTSPVLPPAQESKGPKIVPLIR